MYVYTQQKDREETKEKEEPCYVFRRHNNKT